MAGELRATIKLAITMTEMFMASLLFPLFDFRLRMTNYSVNLRIVVSASSEGFKSSFEYK
jgi:hypothetical protein